jgi:hypothetical protein
MVEGESIIGDAICKIADKLSTYSTKENKQNKTISYLKDEWEGYKQNATLRMKIKDAWFILSFLGFMVFAIYIAFNIDKLNTPSITMNGATVSGNCTWIRDEWTVLNGGKRNISKYDSGSTIIQNFTVESKKDCEVCQICEPCKNKCKNQVQQNCPPQQECICPAPVTIYEKCDMTEKVTHELLNLRPPANGNSAVSGGYHMCLQDVYKTFDIKNVSKWSYQTDGSIYNKADDVEFNDSMYCFVKQSGSDYFYTDKGMGIFLNASLWNWSYTNISWMEYNFTTTWVNLSDENSIHLIKKNITYEYLRQNYSNNLFVWRIK